MNSPCFPAARAEPATESSAAAIAAAARLFACSEIGRKLHTARANHRSTTLQASEAARRRDRVIVRALAKREVEHRTERQTHSAHGEGDGGDIALLLGSVDRSSAVRLARIIGTLPLEILPV